MNAFSLFTLFAVPNRDPETECFVSRYSSNKSVHFIGERDKSIKHILDTIPLSCKEVQPGK